MQLELGMKYLKGAHKENSPGDEEKVEKALEALELMGIELDSISERLCYLWFQNHPSHESIQPLVDNFSFNDDFKSETKDPGALDLKMKRKRPFGEVLSLTDVDNCLFDKVIESVELDLDEILKVHKERTLLQLAYPFKELIIPAQVFQLINAVNNAVSDKGFNLVRLRRERKYVVALISPK